MRSQSVMKVPHLSLRRGWVCRVKYLIRSNVYRMHALRSSS